MGLQWERSSCRCRRLRIDFAHPDFNGTQAVLDDPNSPYDGWGIMHDPISLVRWQRMVWPIRRPGTLGGSTRPVSMPIRIMIPCSITRVGISMALHFRYQESIIRRAFRLPSNSTSRWNCTHFVSIHKWQVLRTILIDIDRDGDSAMNHP
ncbi:MAG: hypothetical protein Ct9H90mP16_19790 [Candidatus Poseidoniales archaeon]|nr:MAG: hypothetical protein Ct9H90mP16_19790 [Candidatus Poseidoniales archaeon]